MENTIKKLLVDIIHLEDNTSVSDDTDLRLLGLNSLRVIDLIINLEDIFEIEILEEDLSMDNFSTIRNIIEIIEKTGTH